ncbi:hypothetical protein HPB47_018343, partial [Ixodes persulcatus]
MVRQEIPMPPGVTSSLWLDDPIDGTLEKDVPNSMLGIVATTQFTEVLWNQIRPTLPSKKKTSAKEGTVVILGEQLIPEKHKLILQRGPKFSFEPVLNRVEKLGISRSVPRQVPEEEKQRCIAECVDVLARTEGRPTRSRALEL